MLACVQDDIKRVLAYSTVSQLGYMMAAIGAGLSRPGFFHLLTHGFFKALLFLGAGAVIHAVGSNDLSRMGGLARRMPQTAIVVRRRHAVAGRHPALRAASCRRKRSSARCGQADLTGPFVLLMLVAFLTAFYMFRVVFLAFFGTRRAGVRGACRHHDERASWRARTRPAGADAAAAVDPGAAVDGGRHLLDVHRAGAALPHLRALPSTLPGAGSRRLRSASRSPASCSRGSPISAGPSTPASLAAMFGPIRHAALAKFWLDDLFERVLAGAARLLARSSAGSIATWWTACSTW